MARYNLYSLYDCGGGVGRGCSRCRGRSLEWLFLVDWLSTPVALFPGSAFFSLYTLYNLVGRRDCRGCREFCWKVLLPLFVGRHRMAVVFSGHESDLRNTTATG
jgi:hypothetical protein